MLALSRPNLSAFPNSPYAVELQRGVGIRGFSAPFESEYLRAHLLGNRSLIRVAAVLTALVAAFRGTEQAVAGHWVSTALVGLLLIASIVMVHLAWSRSFERLYLPVARVLVPARNAVASLCVGAAAAHGQPETLMVLPLMVVGPFFFLGLSFRIALLSAAVTIAAYMASTAIFDLPLPVTLRSSIFLLLAATGCAIAALHLEKWSRTSFLESRLIADLAQHDALTGLKNRRVFDEHLGRLWQQAIEDDRAIAVLLIDVDYFKAYNDLYGHQAGDETLHKVAQTLQAFVSRPLDVLARYGGEEFSVVLYDVDAERAEQLADRMRRAVGELGIEHRGSPVVGAVSISVGVAVIEPTAERRLRGALQLADQALYDAKVKGRNRVVLMDQAAYSQLKTGVFAKTSLAG
jgi:diguanylate cyclase (GGDEF)-like protein